MLLRKRADIASSEITPESIYRRRRAFLRESGLLGAGLLLGAGDSAAGLFGSDPEPATVAPKTLDYQQAARDGDSGFYTDESLTPFEYCTGYNNFYEFGTGKTDPRQNGHLLETRPWEVVVDGEVERPMRVGIEDILARHPLQERVYRLRCVEGWSMVIPWVGFPLADFIRMAKPNSKAKFVAFETLERQEQMPGQRSRFAYIDWPYREGLRMDEAMHPLTLLAVGLYGKELLGQNGAPIRLVVPWKYGFKSIKSIVRISFVETQPPTAWNMLQPKEYGFYSNVNPKVDHPRWSQATERRLPNSLLAPARTPTLMFNGYAEQVAGLYQGMDLRRYF